MIATQNARHRCVLSHQLTQAYRVELILLLLHVIFPLKYFQETRNPDPVSSTLDAQIAAHCVLNKYDIIIIIIISLGFGKRLLPFEVTIEMYSHLRDN